MKIIDLLNKIANGEEVPKKIKYQNVIYIYYERLNDMFNYKSDDKRHRFLEEDYYIENILNDEVEILEEEKPTQEEIKEYTNKFLEAWIPVKKQFGKLFDEIARIDNGLDLEDELEEEKKIPEKLEKKLIYTREPNGFEHPDDELPSAEEMLEKINEIIDYLKSKGE